MSSQRGHTSGHPTMENYTRIFIMGEPGMSDNEIQGAFSKFGDVLDVHIVKPRSGAISGVYYVTFNKASEAALAIEEMNGRNIGDHSKPIKVVLANTKVEGRVRDPNEHEKMLRIFIMVSRSMTEDEIEEEFKEFGGIEYVKILRDRDTKASKGLAYVKYHRAYHAALAVENCDPKFKPMFASTDFKPRSSSSGGFEMGGSRGGSSSYYETSASRYGGGSSFETEDRYSSDYPAVPRFRESSYSASSSSYGDTSFSSVSRMIQSYPSTGQCLLEAVVYNSVTEQQITKLFDLIPSLDYCKYDQNTGLAVIKYLKPECASYAKDKLDGFEYPPGSKMGVRFYPDKAPGDGSSYLMRQGIASGVSNSLDGTLPTGENIQTLIQTIEKATTLLQKAGVPVSGGSSSGRMSRGLGGSGSSVSVSYTDVLLPPRQPLAPASSPILERLFIVSQPNSFPDDVMKDCFCRFGDMISAYFIPGKRYGYVKYAAAGKAGLAQELLHGQMVAGNRIKVILADPQKRGGDADDDLGERGAEKRRGMDSEEDGPNGKQRRYF